jgi:hypothetical protein
MKNKDDAMDWFPLWVDKWIFGTTRIELEPDERGVWVDLMAVASKDHGFIRANVGVAYPIKQLSGLLCISEILLERTIEKCLQVNKLSKCDGNGGYYIPHWDSYQLSERHKKRFKQNVVDNKQMSSNLDIVSEKQDTIGEDRRGYKEEDSIIPDGKPHKDFISSLKENPAYKEIDIDKELHKMDAWLSLPKNKGRKKTHRFILNWLNKIDRPVSSDEAPPTDKLDRTLWEIKKAREKDGHTKPT